MIGVELADGLGLWAEDEIACWAPERGRRWRVVRGDGLVGHRWSGPAVVENWVACGACWVGPGHLRWEGEEWVDPAGFGLGGGPLGGPLGGAALGEGNLDGKGRERGAREGDLARLVRVKGGYRTEDRAGRDLGLWSAAEARELAARHGCELGSPWAELRDWPQELARAEGDWLGRHFGEARGLLRQLCYQAVRFRELGREQSYGSTHRGFWYDPVVSTLHRARLVGGAMTEEALYDLYGRILEEMVGRDRLFSYADLGFADPGGRWMGGARREVLLFVEKDSLRNYALACHERFGLSLWLSGGAPKLIAAEYLARELGVGRVRLLAYVDFDPAGWSGAEAAAEQLRNLGLEVTGPEFVIRGTDFSAEEQELYAIPCPIGNQAMKTKTRRWLEKSGGVEGRARGIHCNHFKPLERLLKRVEELL